MSRPLRRGISRPAGVFAIFVVCASLFSACGDGDDTSASSSSSSGGDPYLIGGDGPLSGPLASSRSQLDGAIAFFEQFERDGNEIHGRGVEFTPLDDGGQADRATANIRQLVADGAVAIIGPQASSLVPTAIPAAQQVQVPLVTSGATREHAVPPQDYVFLGSMDVVASANIQLQFLRDELDLPEGAKIAYVGLATAIGATMETAVRDTAEDMGYEVAYADNVAPDATDLTPVARQIQDSDADAVVLGIPDVSWNLLVRALGTIDIPVVDYYALSPEIVLNQADPNLYFVQPLELPSADNPAMQRVRDAADASGGDVNGFGFTLSWVSAEVVAAALEECGPDCDGEGMNEALANTTVDIPGVTFGPVGFSPENHIIVNNARVYHYDESTDALAQVGDVLEYTD